MSELRTFLFLTFNFGERFLNKVNRQQIRDQINHNVLVYQKRVLLKNMFDMCVYIYIYIFWWEHVYIYLFTVELVYSCFVD